eukprot:1187810-Prorocentrum_minimum.AAC.6
MGRYNLPINSLKHVFSYLETEFDSLSRCERALRFARPLRPVPGARAGGPALCAGDRRRRPGPQGGDGGHSSDSEGGGGGRRGGHRGGRGGVVRRGSGHALAQLSGER